MRYSAVAIYSFGSFTGGSRYTCVADVDSVNSNLVYQFNWKRR